MHLGALIIGQCCRGARFARRRTQQQKWSRPHTSRMRLIQIVVAACSIAPALWYIGVGSSAVQAPFCAPSREAALEPRWLEDALDAAGVPARVEPAQPKRSLTAPLRSVYDAFQDAFGSVPAPEPTTQFLLARWAVQLTFAAPIVAVTIEGVRVMDGLHWIGPVTTGFWSVLGASGAFLAVVWDSNPGDGFLAGLVNGLALLFVTMLAGPPLFVLSSIAPLAGLISCGLRLCGWLRGGPVADSEPGVDLRLPRPVTASGATPEGKRSGSVPEGKAHMVALSQKVACGGG